ncbi:zinc finger protein 2-like [Pleuronectes platessa]|uniref:zinc finger protein 2-like n=1 Tax=Pleuronectes platessa TaxID=8262 RepID=UPI00232A6E5A|nr:zinc finger protein 2-like [Pleuronectes platessa]
MSAVQQLRVSVHERISAAAEDFLLQVEKGGGKAQVPAMRALLTERLTAAGEEILAGLEETLAEYEDRVEQSERVIRRQRRLLDAVMQPEVRLHRAVCHADVQQLMVNNEEVPPEQQRWSPLVDQEDPEPPHIKEEHEEPWTNQDEQQLQGLEEADIKFTLTPVAVKSEEDKEKRELSKLHPSETKENRADWGTPEPARNSGFGGRLQPGPENKTEFSSETEDNEDDWTETLTSPRPVFLLCPAYIQQMMVNNEEVLPEHQQWSPLVDQEDPEPPHIKEEQEEPWTNQDGQQLQGLEEADIKFTLTPVAVNIEEDEEKLKSSKLHPSETKENRADCGGPELARNSGPDRRLPPGPEDKTEVSSETEGCVDDWMEAREPQTGLNTRNNKQPLSDMGGKNLNTHMTHHKGEKAFSCTECCKSFIQWGLLNKHMRIHTGEKPFSCSECGKIFHLKGNLTRHMRNHTGDKPFSCSECGKRFTQRSSLNVHMRSHTEVKRISCSECGEIFKEREHLDTHMSTHTGERPFSCSECGKRFKKRGHLNTHMSTHTGEKPFSCSECGKRFKQRGTLNGHMSTHTVEKPFSCSDCCKRFKQRGTLTKHLRSHAREKPFS